MTQGLQFSLLFSGLDALTTGDTAGLKSNMADSAATQQAAAFRQILQDEQYSKTVRQGQTFAATSAQQQGYSQAIGATRAKESDAKVAQDGGVAASAVVDSAVEDNALEDSAFAGRAFEDSSFADSAVAANTVENSDLAEQWLGLIRQSGDASAQLKQKAEMAKLFFTAQPAADAEQLGAEPTTEAEHFAKLAGPDNANAGIPDNLERMLSQKKQDLATEKPAAQVTSNTGMLTATSEELTSETDADSGSLDATLDKTKVETDELTKKQQAKSANHVTAATQPGLPLASGATTATESASLSQANSESKDKQNDTALQAMTNQAALAKNDAAKAALAADNSSQEKLTKVTEDAGGKALTELANQKLSAAEPKLAAHVEAAALTTAVKSDADIDTPSETKPETTGQAITTASVNTASGSPAAINTTADDAALARVVNLSEANVSIVQSKPSTEVVTSITPDSSEAKKQPDTLSAIRLAEQIGSTESSDVAPSNVATINLNGDGKTSVRDKASANLAETVAVNTNKSSGSKADKGADTGDSQSEQQGQSRQDGRQYTFNRLDVTLTPNTAQPAATVAPSASTQVNDTAAVIARAESFATVLEQQSRPQSAVAAPSLAATLKQLNLQQQDAAGQLRERVQLMVRQNVQVAEIRLDPAELGQMQIRVNLQQEQASVQFIVQQQHAKELLEQQMPKLRELLQQQGIQLGEGQVQQQTREERQQAEQRAAGGAQHNDDKQTGTDSANQTTTIELKQSERLVDYYA